jgi:hypothetical protein
MRSVEKLKRQQNHRLVLHKMELLYKVLTDQIRNDVQCKNVFGTDVEGLKSYIQKQIAELGADYTMDEYKHTWDIGFHYKPNRLDMSNPLQRGTAFFYENMFAKRMHH